MNGTKYNKGSVVVLSNDSLPSFGEIIDIFIDSKEHYLVCATLYTICFKAHFHAYEISRTAVNQQYIICTPSYLKDHQVYCFYNIATHPNHFIPMKYHIVEDMYYSSD